MTDDFILLSAEEAEGSSPVDRLDAVLRGLAPRVVDLPVGCFSISLSGVRPADIIGHHSAWYPTPSPGASSLSTA